MSFVTDYIKANRASCVGLWDFGAASGAGAALSVPELIHGHAEEAWVASSGWASKNNTGSGFGGQDKYSTIAGVTSTGAQIAQTSTSPGSFTFAEHLSVLTYEIMLKLASASGTQDIIGPDGNTNGGMTIRTNTGTWEAVENYIAVPSSGGSVTTAWHIIATTIDLTSNFNWRVYVDGVLTAGPQVNNSPSPTSSKPFDLMYCNHANNTALGSVGYVAVYNTALSAANLLDNYTQALNGAPVVVAASTTDREIARMVTDPIQAQQLASRLQGRRIH